MAGLFDIAERALTDSLLGSKLPLTQASVLGWGVMTLAVTLTGLGIGCGLYGSYLWLDSTYSPALTFAATGALSFVLGLLFLGVLGLAQYFQQRQVARLRQSLTRRLHSGMNALEEEFGESIRDNPKLALFLSSMAGFVIEKRLN